MVIPSSAPPGAAYRLLHVRSANIPPLCPIARRVALLPPTPDGHGLLLPRIIESIISGPNILASRLILGALSARVLISWEPGSAFHALTLPYRRCRFARILTLTIAGPLCSLLSGSGEATRLQSAVIHASCTTTTAWRPQRAKFRGHRSFASARATFK